MTPSRSRKSAVVCAGAPIKDVLGTKTHGSWEPIHRGAGRHLIWGTRVDYGDYRFAPGGSPSPIFWRYTLQPRVVPCTSIFRIFSSREVCAVTKQLLNRYQSYVLESPWIKVLS